jgi:hypothetical protein
MNSFKDMLSSVAFEPKGKVMGAYPLGPLGMSNPQGSIYLVGQTPIWPIGWNALYQFNDREAYDRIYKKLNTGRVIVVDYYAKGEWNSMCWRPSGSYDPLILFGPNHGKINASRNQNIREKLSIKIDSPQALENIRQMTEIKVRISDACK